MNHTLSGSEIVMQFLLWHVDSCFATLYHWVVRGLAKSTIPGKCVLSVCIYLDFKVCPYRSISFCMETLFFLEHFLIVCPRSHPEIVSVPLFTADDFSPEDTIWVSCEPMVFVTPYILMVAVVDTRFPLWEAKAIVQSTLVHNKEHLGLQNRLFF